MKPGDVILVNGLLGDHGAAILCARGDMELETSIESDCAALNGLIEGLLAAAPSTRCIRDATRGGVATVLNEIADASGVSIEIDEALTPLRAEVRGFCEILGLDPLYLANEGKIVIAVPPEESCGGACRFVRTSARPGVIDHRPCRPWRARSRHHADSVRRATHRRHAGRRAIAADLLTMTRESASRLFLEVMLETKTA